MNPFEPPKASKYKGSKKNGSGNGAVAANGHTSKEDAPQLDHRQILSALRAFKRGDFTAKMREDLSGVDGQIAETFNELVEMVKTIKEEAADVSTAVGKEGQAQKRMRRLNASGGWAQYITAVNEVITDLTGHANEIARVIKAVGNTGSGRISEKHGMRLVGVEERDFVAGRLPAEIWEISREAWHALRPSLPT